LKQLYFTFPCHDSQNSQEDKLCWYPRKESESRVLVEPISGGAHGSR